MLKIICDEVVKMYKNELIDLGQNIQKDMVYLLKENKYSKIIKASLL